MMKTIKRWKPKPKMVGTWESGKTKYRMIKTVFSADNISVLIERLGGDLLGEDAWYLCNDFDKYPEEIKGLLEAIATGWFKTDD